MTRLPSLGPHGEGWFLGQVAILIAIGVSAATGPAWTGPAQIASAIVGAILVGVGLWAGIRGVVELKEAMSPMPVPEPDARLVVDGIYAIVRHPIYVGVILASIGWSLAWAAPLGLLLTGLLAVWFDLKARREEAWLLERHPAYAVYRTQTSRFIPGVY